MPQIPTNTMTDAGGPQALSPDNNNNNNNNNTFVERDDNSISNNNNNNNNDQPIIMCGCERRWFLFLFAFGSTSLVAGVVYGWPSLRRQLLEDGSTLTEKQFGVVYTVGSWSVQGSRFFTGVARDRYGTRTVACASLVCSLCGAIGIGLADASSVPALGTSLFIMGLGAGCQLVVQPVGSLFPGASNAIISSLSGSFQISGLVFLALTSLPSMTRRQAFLSYAGLVAMFTVTAWWCLPVSASFLPTSTETTTTDLDITQEPSSLQNTSHHAGEEKEGDESNNSQQQPANTEIAQEIHCDIEKTGTPGQDSSPSTLQQMVSVEFIALLAWFTTLLVPLQYYVGSIGFQLEAKGDDDGFYTDLFNIIYAAVAILAPAGGYLSDRIGLGWTQGMSTVMVALSMFILGSDSIPLSSQSVGLVLYSIGRMFIFSMFFSNIGRRFGYENFGTLSGVGLLLSAVVSPLQYPLITLASEGSTMAVNFTLGAIILSLTPYCIWLAVIEKRHDSARSLLKVEG